MIACMCSNRGIGKDGKIPWHNPEDLKYFRKKTLGNIVVMGRKTYDSLNGTPLIGRLNIVITSTPEDFKNTEELIFTTPAKLSELFNIFSDSYLKCFIIGGEDIYRHFIDKVSRLYLTRIDKEYECDTFFPEFERFFMLTKASKYMQTTGKDKHMYRFEKYMSIMID
jgi:dihydrofolate reductase